MNNIHYYQDDKRFLAIIVEQGRGPEPYKLICLYTNEAIVHSCATFDKAEKLLKAAGEGWTELPVLTTEEPISQLLAK